MNYRVSVDVISYNLSVSALFWLLFSHSFWKSQLPEVQLQDYITCKHGCVFGICAK